MSLNLSGVLWSILLCCASCAPPAAEPVPAWLVGTWTPIFDEDGTPPDFADFTADGKYINHGFDCSVRTEMPFHIHGGDIYAPTIFQAKGRSRWCSARAVMANG